MPPPCHPSTIAAVIESFVAEHDVASLRLPSGWFGRPHDNMHRLSGVGVDGDHVLVTLDETQVLTLDAADSTVDGRVLYVTIRGVAGTGPSTAATTSTARRWAPGTWSSTPSSAADWVCPCWRQ